MLTRAGVARILLLSDCPQMTTSYATIAYNTALELRKRGHDVAFVGMQHAGSPSWSP